MKLQVNLPDPTEYRLQLRMIASGATLEFRIKHPKTGETVREFETMHERLMHAFLISADLQDFAHEHPLPQPDGGFLLPVRFSRPVPYRVVADFFPKGGTPQFLTKTVFPAGASLVAPPTLTPGNSRQSAANLDVELATEPAEPVAGQETLLIFHVKPSEGVQRYLGAWGHLLAASDDLVDIVHEHPLYVDGVAPPDLRAPSPERIQFNLIFARERTYRVWVQIQCAGTVNTVAFTIPVKALR